MTINYRITISAVFIFMTAAALLAVLPQQVSADLTSSTDSYITIRCETPGQIIEAGETASFDITVENTGDECNRQLWYETFDDGPDDWEVRFYDGTREINILSLETGSSKDLTVEVETSSGSPEGKYSIRLHAGDGYYWLYVTISESHEGEKGTLEMTVVDNEGEKIKGAVITVMDEDDRSTVDTFMSTADGTVSAVVVPGTYIVEIGKNGYSTVEKKDVKMKGGITTDIGTVMLEKSLFAAEVTVQSPILTTTASTNAQYAVSIDNTGKSDDTYKLSVEGSPSGWYFRFRESSGQASDLSEVFIESGSGKDLTLEAIPSYGVETGSYNFTMVVDSSQAIYSENLTATIRGDYELDVYADQYQYDFTKGGTPLTFDLILSNGGTAGALTNVEVSVTAPDGWNVDTDPETIAGIQPGQARTVSLRIVPPGDIAASEYKISVDVTSDQTEAGDDFRIVVHEQSFIGVIGILLILALGAGVLFMFRKYSRR